MGKYNFVSGGAMAGNAISQFLAEREAQNRQRMLDQFLRDGAAKTTVWPVATCPITSRDECPYLQIQSGHSGGWRHLLPAHIQGVLQPVQGSRLAARRTKATSRAAFADCRRPCRS